MLGADSGATLIATVAFYGPTADLATKIAVSIIPDERNSPDQLERWFSEGIDVRRDPVVGEQVLAFLRQHQARSVVVTDSVIGCPHEEGIDYPKGHSCPHCPYWAGATASPMNASTSRAPGFSAAWLSRPLNYPTQSLAI